MILATFYFLFGREKSSILYDATDKKILFKNNIHAKCHPASLTKIMTLYILFKNLKEKKISLKSKIKISHNASKMPPCRLDVKIGAKITVEEAIKSLIIRSANNVSIAVSEFISGNEKDFVKLMNSEAKRLKLKDTNFCNPSGWHNSNQVSSAADITKLSCAIYRDFPQYYHYFSLKKFMFNGKWIHTHNHLVKNMREVDGIKTGYTIPSGWNIATSGVKYDKNGKPHRLILVVLGEDSQKERDIKAKMLMEKCFSNKVQIINCRNKINSINKIHRINCKNKIRNKNRLKVAKT